MATRIIHMSALTRRALSTKPRVAMAGVSASRAPPELDGKVAWVVGGIGIVGSGLVRGLLRAGATVIVNSRFPSRLEYLNEELGA